MPRWIETSTGFVNLDHVVRLDPAYRQDRERGWRPYKVTLADGHGTQATCWLQEDVCLPELLADVIPAAAGQEAFTISAYPYDERPTEVSAVTRYPVIAWRIVSADLALRWPAPVLPTPVADNEFLFLCLPDGRLSGTGTFEGEEFDDLDAAKAAVLRQAQKEWDRCLAAHSAA